MMNWCGPLPPALTVKVLVTSRYRSDVWEDAAPTVQMNHGSGRQAQGEVSTTKWRKPELPGAHQRKTVAGTRRIWTFAWPWGRRGRLDSLQHLGETGYSTLKNVLINAAYTIINMPCIISLGEIFLKVTVLLWISCWFDTEFCNKIHEDNINHNILLSMLVASGQLGALIQRTVKVNLYMRKLEIDPRP